MASKALVVLQIWITRLLRLCEYGGWLIMLFWVGLLTVGAIARYAFSSPFIFTGDLTSALLLVFCSLSFGPVLLRNAHVRVDTVTRLLPERIRRLCDDLNDLATIAFCILLIALMQGILKMTFALGSRFEVSQLPMWPFQAIMPVGFVLMALASLVALIERHSGVGSAADVSTSSH